MPIQGAATAFSGLNVPARRPVAPVPKRPVAAPVSQSLAQVANQRVNQQLNPQIAAANAFNAQQNKVIQQFANALLGKLQPVAGQVGADYNQAIQQVGSLSGQAAQYLNAQNPAASQQQLLGSVGAPAAQQAQSAQALGDTFRGGAGVLAFTGGTIPGSELATDKAAAQAQAAQLPGLAALKGQQDLASALWQQGQDRRTLEATRPALLQAAEQDIRTNNAARAKAVAAAKQNAITNALKVAGINEKSREFTATQSEKSREFNLSRSDKAAATTEKQREFNVTAGQKQAAADFLQWYRTQGVNQSEAKINEKAKEFGVTATQRQQTIAQGAQRIGIQQQNANTSAVRANNASAPKYSASVSRSLGRRSDQYGNPIQGGALLPGFKRAANGAIVKVGTARSGTKASGAKAPRALTPTEASKFTKSAQQIATNAVNGGTDPKTGKVLPPIGRDQARQEMELAGLFADPRTAKLAMQALNEAYGLPPRTSKVKSSGPFGVQATATP